MLHCQGRCISRLQFPRVHRMLPPSICTRPQGIGCAAQRTKAVWFADMLTHTMVAGIRPCRATHQPKAALLLQVVSEGVRPQLQRRQGARVQGACQLLCHFAAAKQLLFIASIQASDPTSMQASTVNRLLACRRGCGPQRC